MAVIQVQTHGDQVINPMWPRRHLRHTLEPALAKLPKNAPIVVYVHGHQDWPQPDILRQAQQQVGLAITLSWPAKARFCGMFPDVTQLYQDAGDAAPALAVLINLLGELAPGRPVDLLAHSLGARVGLQALPLLKHGNLARLVGLAAVEFSAITLIALQAPVARDIAFYNITTTQISAFHRIMHHFGPRPGPADRLLCTGFAFPRTNWIDICLDKPAVQRPLAQWCKRLRKFNPEIAKETLVSQIEAMFLQDRSAMTIPELRNLLGPAIPGPMSMVPVRTPPNRA